MCGLGGLWRWLGAGVGVLLVSGCAARVTPPDSHKLTQPADVYLLDHGRHASLVLPHEKGGVARYSYGDWRWYVEGEQRFWVGVTAMLWPTKAGLGRGLYPHADLPQDMESLAPEGLDEAYVLQAELQQVRLLQRQLDSHFAQQALFTPVYSATHGLDFVPYPRHYTAFHQSNLKVAQWLRALNMQVTGSPWLSNWKVVGHESEPSAY